jgi:signal transduction histidine kinase
MSTRFRWLTVIVPIALIGIIELASDSVLDSLLPFPLDTLLVMAIIAIVAIVLSRLAFGRIDRLAETLRQRNRELEARNASASALHRVSVATSSLTDIDAILRAVVANARTLLHADVAVLVLAQPDGTLRLAASAGQPGVVHESGDLPGRDFMRFVPPDLARTRLAAPLHRGGRTIGTLAVGSTGERTYGVDAVESLTSLASQAAIALENDRLHRELRELAIRAERERIAREMHDGLAQVLGYVNTKSQAVEELLAVGRVDAARAQLGQLAAAARSVYVDVREAILGLTSPIPPGGGLVGALEEYARRFSEASKLAVAVEASEAARGVRLPPEAQAQVFRVVQEALTNVRKHASAGRATITLDGGPGSLVVAVDDDGRGFDPDASASGDWPTFGLRAMRERAATLGATLEVAERPAGGTRLVLAVPLGSNAGNGGAAGTAGAA